MSLLWSFCSVGLGISGELALQRVSFIGCYRERFSTYIVFAFCRLDIEAVKKAVTRYKHIARAKINFDKSKGLQVGDWRSGVSLPGHIYWSNRPIHILGV